MFQSEIFFALLIYIQSIANVYDFGAVFSLQNSHFQLYND